jgi:hypothetical protein
MSCTYIKHTTNNHHPLYPSIFFQHRSTGTHTLTDHPFTGTRCGSLPHQIQNLYLTMRYCGIYIASLLLTALTLLSAVRFLDASPAFLGDLNATHHDRKEQCCKRFIPASSRRFWPAKYQPLKPCTLRACSGAIHTYVTWSETPSHMFLFKRSVNWLVDDRSDYW